MKECNKIILLNHGNKVRFRQLLKHGIIRLDCTRFTRIGGNEIKIILNEVSKCLSLYKRGFRKLEIYFDRFTFADKLTYIIFECIIYDLFKSYEIIIDIKFNEMNYSLQTKGVSESIFKELINGDIDYKEFVRKFSKIYKECHFRKVIDGNAPDDSLDLCDLMSEIKTFLKYFEIDELYRNQISEMICELADNAREHTKTDCLIDIDVTTNYFKYNNNDKNYCALNIVIINFSDTCLGDSLKEKILNFKYNNSERYEKVNEAYNIHKQLFDKDYGIEDFFNIVSFQDKVSGRFYDTSSGGTGLTSLITSLEENSDTHYGYVLSGNRGINFKLDYLKFNEDEWIGFNEENDFINKIPSKDVILTSPTYIPGTAYNFTLVVEIGGYNNGR